MANPAFHGNDQKGMCRNKLCNDKRPATHTSSNCYRDHPEKKLIHNKDNVKSNSVMTRNNNKYNNNFKKLVSSTRLLIEALLTPDRYAVFLLEMSNYDSYSESTLPSWLFDISEYDDEINTSTNLLKELDIDIVQITENISFNFIYPVRYVLNKYNRIGFRNDESHPLMNTNNIEISYLSLYNSKFSSESHCNLLRCKS
jgi:hypothetical protein